ncbi:MAG: HAMP domain-containing sensor histidine kinase [Proteobacteria bacterium]|nr:HAMP domain-containing sensor histidine kinase [Pseudomonadota bacterium]
MANNRFQRIIHSVFTKILLTLLVAGISINLIAAVFFIHGARESLKGAWQHNIDQYLEYIIKDLGTPPSMERAKNIVKQAALQIRYESPDLTWTTSNEIPTSSMLHLKTDQKNHFIRMPFKEGKYIIALSRGSDTYIFSFHPHPPLEKRRIVFIILLVFILTIVVLIAYLIIRRILRPVKYLSEGVRQVASGHLDHRVPTSCTMEFGQLAEAFNDMTLRIQNMLHAKDQLLLDVSHELRSPLTRMKVALELMPDGQTKENVIDDIREMEIMISEILEAARLRNTTESLQIESIPVKNFLSEICEIHSNKQPGIRIGDIPDNACIHGDPMLVKIVFNNIISNAVKYSSPDGEPVKLSWKEDPQYAIVEIQDRGVGIPETELPYIFEPFYRVDKSRSKHTGGYGLGLSLCKTIMESHQGKIEVESAPGTGTIVSLFFPLINNSA